MKARKLIHVFLLLLSYFTASSQGDSYSNSIPLIMDGVIRNFATSAGSGANVLCTANGTTPVTWFSVTANGSGHCPLVTVTASDGSPVEIGMYNLVIGFSE